MRGQALLTFDEAATLADAEAAIMALHERTVAKLTMLEGAPPALTQALPATSWAAQPSATAEGAQFSLASLDLPLPHRAH